MKCPYNINIEQVSQDTYIYEEGNATFHQNKLMEKREFTECCKEECAVWVDGKCNYNQGHNG